MYSSQTDSYPYHGPKKLTTTVDIHTSGVLAFKTKDGIFFAAMPFGGKYSTIKIRNLRRFAQVCPNVVLASSGDFSDFQKISTQLKKKWH